MIDIFDTEKKLSDKAKLRRKRQGSAKSSRDKLAKENLSRLNPMAFGIIAVKVGENPSNEFLSSTREVIFERPYALTEKWINSINKFVDSTVKSALLDPPPIPEGSRASFEKLVVAKCVPAKELSQYPMPALICVDKRGWKFWFKTSKAYSFPIGSTVSFSATISAHKEGITFLRRPSKIKTTELSSGASEKCND